MDDEKVAANAAAGNNNFRGARQSVEPAKTHHTPVSLSVALGSISRTRATHPTMQKMWQTPFLVVQVKPDQLVLLNLFCDVKRPSIGSPGTVVSRIKQPQRAALNIINAMLSFMLPASFD